MRSALPFILVLLAVFAAGCIAYIAWELTSDKREHNSSDSDDGMQDLD
jgi:threonine/homoserine/homoserine lactone efflux protein